MPYLEETGEKEGDLPQVKCSDCKKTMTIIWQKEWGGERIEYCPFCGVEFDCEDDGRDYLG